MTADSQVWKKRLSINRLCQCLLTISLCLKIYCCAGQYQDFQWVIAGNFKTTSETKTTNLLPPFDVLVQYTYSSTYNISALVQKKNILQGSLEQTNFILISWRLRLLIQTNNTYFGNKTSIRFLFLILEVQKVGTSTYISRISVSFNVLLMKIKTKSFIIIMSVGKILVMIYCHAHSFMLSFILCQLLNNPFCHIR